MDIEGGEGRVVDRDRLVGVRPQNGRSPLGYGGEKVYANGEKVGVFVRLRKYEG
ncbi:hypothetical protein Hanom_Chr00s000006g01613611 [Helianthus anomalus]